MTRGIIISADDATPLLEQEFHGLEDYQAAVRGPIEVIPAHPQPLTLCVNEEGKPRRLPINRRATSLWWLMSPARRGGDALRGDVVIFGVVGARAEWLDVDEELRTLLLDTKWYQIEVRPPEGNYEWSSLHRQFASYFDAAAAALKLVEQVGIPAEIRVTAA